MVVSIVLTASSSVVAVMLVYLFLAVLAAFLKFLAEGAPFVPGAGDYRVIPDDEDMANLMMSHLSTNFDRTGFFQDVNTAFPIDRLHELNEMGVIGSVASRHYSFMGATPPHMMEPVAKDLAELLKQDGVTAVILVPV